MANRRSENYLQLQFTVIMSPTPKSIPILVTMLPILIVVLVLFLFTGMRQCVLTHYRVTACLVRGEDGARQLVAGKETKLHYSIARHVPGCTCALQS